MEPQKQIHRLQKLAEKHSSQIESLKEQNFAFQIQLDKKNQQLEDLKSKKKKEYKPLAGIVNSGVFQQVQAKISSLTWQIIQYQQINSTYENTIKQLQQQMIKKQRKLTLSEQTIRQLQSINKHHQSIEEDDIDLKDTLKKWRQSIREKQRLNAENFKLQKQISYFRNLNQKQIIKYTDLLNNLNYKMNEIKEKQSEKEKKFQHTVEQLKKQNEKLQQTVSQKNKMISKILLQSSQQKSLKNQDFNHIHTIKNLRKQLKRKNNQLQQIMIKLKKALQVKQRYQKFNKEFQNSFDKLQNLASTCQNLKKQNTQLQIKYQAEIKKNVSYEESWHEDSSKLLQLLKENQACHQLLYQLRGSNIYRKDISQKIQLVLKQMEIRMQREEKWLDITQLINVNKRLRMHRCLDY